MAATQNGVLQKDDNGYPVMGGTSSVDNNTIINSAYDPITRRLLTDQSSSALNFVTNEVVSGSGTSFILANTPTVGTVAVYGNGQRLTPGAGNDYTISGATITTANSFSTGAILSDYQY